MTYNQARYAADLQTYNTYVSMLNALSATYNTSLNESISHFNESAKLNARAKSLGIIEQWGASIAYVSKSKKELKAGEDQLESSKLLLTAYNLYPKYVAFYLQQQGTYIVILGWYNNYTYAQVIAQANVLAGNINNYFDYSIGVTIGTGGTTSFLISADTITTILNLTIDAANDIGLIDDTTYRKIKASPLWQLAINAAASYGMSYAMGNIGFKKSPLGYVDSNTYANMFTSDVNQVFDAINTATSVYEAYSAYKSTKDKTDQKEEVARTQEEIKSYDTDTYATGEYYKTFAGQEFFNIGLAGHDGYVPSSAQTPSWGIVGEKPHSEDPFVSQVMNQNRNMLMAGGAGYLNNITEGIIPLSR